MKTSQRRFDIVPAVRKNVWLKIALYGAGGGGKTRSALRLASGIKQALGPSAGPICLIDTENGRSLEYASDFDFQYVPFGAPFSSLDYLKALQDCAQYGASVIIVDSMSHEHEGEGGMVDYWDQEINRLCRGDLSKMNTYKMLAWQAPKQARRQLLQGFTHVNAHLILCFRAKDSAKPAKDKNGKMDVVAMGFMPIGGDEFVYEMTTSCLLYPKSQGIPTWESDMVGERTMMKNPEQFKHILRPGVQLSEEVGVKLAEWASGGVATNGVKTAPAQTAPAQQSISQQQQPAAKFDPASGIDPALLNGCKTDLCPKCSYLVGFAKGPDGKLRAWNKDGAWHVPNCGQPTGWDEMPPDEGLDDPFVGSDLTTATHDPAENAPEGAAA